MSAQSLGIYEIKSEIPMHIYIIFIAVNYNLLMYYHLDLKITFSTTIIEINFYLTNIYSSLLLNNYIKATMTYYIILEHLNIFSTIKKKLPKNKSSLFEKVEAIQICPLIDNTHQCFSK